MLPELTSRIAGRAKALFSGFGSTPISLDLKGAVGINPYDSTSYLRNGFYGLASALGGSMPAWSGETVSISTALNHSVVWACNRIISESVGFIPAKIPAGNRPQRPQVQKPRV